MRKKIIEAIIVIITLFFLGTMFTHQKIIHSSIIYALNIWVDKLLPTLFPFFIISDILINYNITLYIPKSFKKICKSLFNISDNMLTILLMSMLAGFPSCARNTKSMLEKGLISLDEADHILIFSHFANPVFIMSTVAFFFNDKKMAIIILIAHYTSNFVLGIVFRKNIMYNDNDIEKVKTPNLGEIFISAIRRAIDTILMICGIMGILLMLCNIITSVIIIGDYNEAIIKGIFEITIGIDAVSRLGISNLYKLVLTSAFLAFGGLSVHMQVLSQIVGTDIKYHYFFMGRMWQTIISGIITYFLYYLYQ